MWKSLSLPSHWTHATGLAGMHTHQTTDYECIIIKQSSHGDTDQHQLLSQYDKEPQFKQSNDEAFTAACSLLTSNSPQLLDHQENAGL